MEVILLAVGVLIVALLCGVAIVTPISPSQDSSPSYPPHFMEAAQLLGELHQAHAKAKDANADAAKKLDAYIERLKTLFKV